jgi:death on curing protein
VPADTALAAQSELRASVLQNHPFIDSNKRAGFAAADIHMRVNGWAFDGNPDETAEAIIIEAGRLDREVLDRLLRENTEPI